MNIKSIGYAMTTEIQKFETSNFSPSNYEIILLCMVITFCLVVFAQKVFVNINANQMQVGGICIDYVINSALITS